MEENLVQEVSPGSLPAFTTTPYKSTIPSQPHEMEFANSKPRRHPKVKSMVTTALRKLSERRGCSFYAIKKYISSNYDVDITKKTTYIKRYITRAVSTGNIIRTKGAGFNGRFKLKPKPKRKNKKRPTRRMPKPSRAYLDAVFHVNTPRIKMSYNRRRYRQTESDESLSGLSSTQTSRISERTSTPFPSCSSSLPSLGRVSH